MTEYMTVWGMAFSYNVCNKIAYQMGVRGIICVSLRVFDVKKFGNHFPNVYPNDIF